MTGFRRRLRCLVIAWIVVSSTLMQLVLCSRGVDLDLDLDLGSKNNKNNNHYHYQDHSSNKQQQQQQQIEHRRRHLLQETTCDLILKDVEFAPSRLHPRGYSKEEWICFFAPEDSSKIGGLRYVDIADSNRLETEATDEYGWRTPVRSGISTLTLSSAIVDVSSEGGEPKLYIPPSATITVGILDPTKRSKHQHQIINPLKMEGRSTNDKNEKEEEEEDDDDESKRVKKRNRRRRKRRKKRKREQESQGHNQHPTEIEIESRDEDEFSPGSTFGNQTDIDSDSDTREDYKDRDEDEFSVRRRLAIPPSTGTLRTLVIRVIDRKGTAPDASMDQLREDVFEDQHCLSSQLDACSYGKLSIKPARLGLVAAATTRGTIHNGVAEVAVDYDVSSPHANKEGLQQAALDASFRELGNLYESPYFDLVLYCFPPGTGDWVAYAFVNHKFSFFNNKWCSSVSSQLHEVGHNMGLGHSGQYEWESSSTDEDGDGEAEEELKYKGYADASGVMGFTYSRDDQQICFNAAKSFQLQWYADQSTTLNPLGGTDDQARNKFVFNGVTDYRRNDKTLVVLRLEQLKKEPDYYIGYNRKHGIHRDTMEDPDRITIIRKDVGGPTEYGHSTKVAALDVGESHTLHDFNGEEGRHVKITFLSLDPNKVNALVEVADLSRVGATNPGNDDRSPSIPACADVEIYIQFDRYPTDISWAIVADDGDENSINIDGDNETVVFSSPEYDPEADKEQLVTTTVCLPVVHDESVVARSSADRGRSYRFVIWDSYGDGLCCGQGNGSYKVVDVSNGNVIFGGGHSFSTEEHAMKVLLPMDDTSGPSVVWVT